MKRDGHNGGLARSMTLLSGRAVVTGGASGIGAARGWVLARCDAEDVVPDRAAPNAEPTAREVGGESAIAEVGDEASGRDAVKPVEPNGSVAFLVSSASVIQRLLPPEDQPLDHWDDIVRITGAARSPKSPRWSARVRRYCTPMRRRRQR